jgi:hypothetical protein
MVGRFGDGSGGDEGDYYAVKILLCPRRAPFPAANFDRGLAGTSGMQQ